MKFGKIAIFLFMLLLAVADRAAAQTEYYPKGALDDSEDIDRFTRVWFSKNLTAMNEPSLWEAAKDKKAQAYRFLYLRSFHEPIAVRLTVNTDGTGTLVTKVLDGTGGYEPGKLKSTEQRELSKREVDILLRELVAQDFWKLPARLRADMYGRDGAEWITEAVSNGKYHVIVRWSPKVGKDRALGELFMFRLANLKLLYTEVY